MTATETIATAIKQIDQKKEKLKKAFDDLQSHRSLLSPSFSLSWSEIDSHFSTLQSSLANRFRILQSTAPLEDDSYRLDASYAQTSSSEEISEQPVVESELRALCEKMDGIGLSKYLIVQWDDDALLNQEVSAAIRYSPDPASMVLDAIEGLNQNHTPSSSGKSFDVRRVFVLLMEVLIEINWNITVDTRNRAKKLAYHWKTKIDTKPFEALVFLHLVAAFELGSEFNSEELSDYVFMIAKYKQATSVCNKIGLDRERVRNLIKKLMDSGKAILAVKFMYECGITDEFEPIPVLKSYIKNSREAALRVCVEDNYSIKSQNEAIDKEVSALKAAIKIIKDQNLESEFTQEKVEERVEELEKYKALRKRNATNPPKQEPQQKGKKRTRDGNGAQVPAPSQQLLSRPEALLMPEHSHHGLQLNPYGLMTSAFSGVVVNPLSGLFGSAATPQPLYYAQQTGFVLPPQYHSPYYSQ
ncbi:Frigida-like [Arabidopsis thaliana x Arabidopsis arenosa]|uniref:FRIGIDA-like protein n=1 Tax=Arabidopsis thaliana x Arabidopsis arenosa TaxID=1240361 RepID=A0A8T1YWG4_9BRAS|nr:Frigida-like [Arabidopsis thaliana x Arabidopsis arenosa]